MLQSPHSYSQFICHLTKWHVCIMVIQQAKSNKLYNYGVVPNHAHMCCTSSVSPSSDLHIYYHSPLEQSNVAEMARNVILGKTTMV